jgi:cytochrome c556
VKHPYLACLVVPVLLLSACGEPEDTRPGQPVKHRHDAFVAILKAFEPMRAQLKDGQYDAKRFAAQAQRLDELKEGPWQYFQPDTNYPPSHSTEAVWAEPQKFEAARKTFYEATAQFVAVAGSGDVEKVTAAYERVYDTCRECHKVFKKK